jgi:beta-N-acetylhexosaminidase
MTGHLIAPEIDAEYPATLSPTLTDGVLRGELGFDGVVITDALNMRAVTNKYGAAEAAVLAVKAGADILLAPQNLTRAIEAVTKAVADGDIPPERIDESVTRILALKIKYTIVDVSTSGGSLPDAR